jgi:hypothetical protein
MKLCPARCAGVTCNPGHTGITRGAAAVVAVTSIIMKAPENHFACDRTNRKTSLERGKMLTNLRKGGFLLPSNVKNVLVYENVKTNSPAR